MRPGSRRARRAAGGRRRLGCARRASTGTGRCRRPASGCSRSAASPSPPRRRRRGRGRRRLQIAGDLPRVGRVAAALACLVLAVVPFKLIRYERALSTATTAFYAGDCGPASTARSMPPRPSAPCPGPSSCSGTATCGWERRAGGPQPAARGDARPGLVGAALWARAGPRRGGRAAPRRAAGPGAHRREPLARQPSGPSPRGPRHWERVARRLAAAALSGRPLPSAADRARRGGSGALHPQSALAGLNPLSRGAGPRASASRAGVDGQVPRDGGPRTRSGPEGSSLKRSPAGVAGSPRRSRRRWQPPGTASTEGARSILRAAGRAGSRPGPQLASSTRARWRCGAEHQAGAQRAPRRRAARGWRGTR